MISFQFHSIVINILKTVLRSVAFNSTCIIIFGLIYFFVATDKMPFGEYFILSTKAQFLLPTPSDHLNEIEKNVIHFQKIFGVIGFMIIIIRFSKNLF